MDVATQTSVLSEREAKALQDVERYLESLQFYRDLNELKEMNGSRCANHQRNYLWRAGLNPHSSGRQRGRL